MAPDDDYWHSRNAQDDRRWADNRAAEQRRRLNDALRRRDYRQAGWITGVPPADVGPDDLEDADDAFDIEGLDEPERSEARTVEELFREHKHALLFNLEWVYDFLLPPELRESWARRIELLDLAQPGAGLAAIEAIGDEYRRTVSHYEPSNREVSRRMDWDHFVPRIGDEIERVAALFRDVLSAR
jgi:hypothetical protein